MNNASRCVFGGGGGRHSAGGRGPPAEGTHQAGVTPGGRVGAWCSHAGGTTRASFMGSVMCSKRLIHSVCWKWPSWLNVYALLHLAYPVRTPAHCSLPLATMPAAKLANLALFCMPCCIQPKSPCAHPYSCSASCRQDLAELAVSSALLHPAHPCTFAIPAGCC